MARPINPPGNALGRLVEARRKALGFTRPQVAERCHMSRSRFDRWILASVPPNLSAAQIVAVALALEVSALAVMRALGLPVDYDPTTPEA